MAGQEWNETDDLIFWALLNYFNSKEAWGDWSKMHPLGILILENFRKDLPKGCWIKVHCGYKSTGHTKNSYHYKARGIDFHVVGCSFLEAERHFMKFLKSPKIVDGKEIRLIDYVGLGIYPDWIDPGFHLDTRGKRGNWARLNNEYVAYELGLEKAKELNI